jgi:DNA (cytosine-5)-methyltransferase 1
LLAEVLAKAIVWQLLGIRTWPGSLRLALGQAKEIPPPAIPAGPVPPAYLALKGKHDAHPGTGKGVRASARGINASDQARE